MKKFIYEIHSDIVTDISYVVANNATEATRKFCLWWLEDQGKEIKPDSVTFIKRIGEVIE